MTLCPRCATDNEATRASCWNCFAPLQGAAATRVKPMLLVGKGPDLMMEPVPVQEPGADFLPGAPPPAEPPKKKGLFGLGKKK